jgi:hypothetical protein
VAVANLPIAAPVTQAPVQAPITNPPPGKQSSPFHFFLLYLNYFIISVYFILLFI